MFVPVGGTCNGGWRTWQCKFEDLESGGCCSGVDLERWLVVVGEEDSGNQLTASVMVKIWKVVDAAVV